MQGKQQVIPLQGLDLRYKPLRLIKPECMTGLRASLERDGLLTALVVRPVEDGSFAILDGFKRYEILRELGWKELRVQIVELSETQAKAGLILYNRPHRGLSEIEEAWIVHSLCRDHGLKQVDVADLIGRHKSWVCRRLQFAERLGKELQEDVRLGLIAPTAARALARLPQGNQMCVAEAIKRHRLACRHVERLVELVLASEADAIKTLLEDPLRHVLAAEDKHSQEDPRLSEHGRVVKGALTRFEGAALNLCHKLREVLPMGLSREDATVLVEIVEPARTSGEKTTSEIGKLERSMRQTIHETAS